jgi:endonuclease-3
VPRSREDRGARARRIVRLLEGEYGVPRAEPGGDLVGQLVGTILSQHTTDTSSDAAYGRLRERFGSWDAVEEADRRAIAATIRTAGLARVKARRIKEVLGRIRRERGRIDLGFLKAMPSRAALDYLVGFDGVGPKTAACVLLFGLGRDVMPVDTHVHRVVGRLGIVGRPASREATFAALSDVVPPGKALSLHVNLVRHGRAVCRARSPRCGACVLARACGSGGRARQPRSGTP